MNNQPEIVVCNSCHKRKTVSRVDIGSSTCLSCLGRCIICKFPQSDCTCIGKLEKYRLSVRNSPCYLKRDDLSMSGRIINGLFQMHIRGRVKHHIKQFLSVHQCLELTKMSGIVAVRDKNEFCFRCSNRCTGISSVDCWDDFFSLVFDAIQEGHPSVTSMSVEVMIVRQYTGSCNLLADFPSESSTNTGDEFEAIPLSLIVPINCIGKSFVTIQDKYKDGALKEKEIVKLKTGDGLLIRGRLMYGIDFSFVHLRFGTADCPIVMSSSPETITTQCDSDSECSL